MKLSLKEKILIKNEIKQLFHKEKEDDFLHFWSIDNKYDAFEIDEQMIADHIQHMTFLERYKFHYLLFSYGLIDYSGGLIHQQIQDSKDFYGKRPLTNYIIIILMNEKDINEELKKEQTKEIYQTLIHLKNHTRFPIQSLV